mmetsp:Transcript_18385/g.54622  ORF Transcript_18385/g.54622 Transcript_18385/m.54622 type:complete len:103 (+) Transcript_18385:186-494(+)
MALAWRLARAVSTHLRPQPMLTSARALSAPALAAEPEPPAPPARSATPVPPAPREDDDDDDLEDMFVDTSMGREWGGPTRGGRMPEPTRFGDWERKGRATDF